MNYHFVYLSFNLEFNCIPVWDIINSRCWLLDLGKKNICLSIYLSFNLMKLHKTKKKKKNPVIRWFNSSSSEIIHLILIQLFCILCSDASPILKGSSFSTRNITACSEYFAISYRFPQIASPWTMLKSQNIQAYQCHSYSSVFTVILN